MFINKKIILLLFLSFIIFIQCVSATTLVSSTVSVEKIFKCQATIITATFNNDDIISLSATLNGQMIMEGGRVLRPADTVVMNKISNGVWQGTYGNDENLKWGEKSISFSDNNNVVYTGGTLFVYSDKCTGTGVTKYTQINSGMGRYTRLLYQENFTFIGTSMETSFIGWALYPWTEIFGYVLYLFVVFIICSTIYIKTQNLTQPLTIAVIMLLVMATTIVIDPIYRKWILIILAIAIGAIYYRLFVKE
jgi:hypothetical protein